MSAIIPPAVPILHVVIPVFNERRTLDPCVRRVIAVALPEGWDRRLWLVDDHSEQANFDAAAEFTEQLVHEGHAVTIHRHAHNRGKGAALQTGFDSVLEAGPTEEDVVIIQDADVEYDPADYPALLEPVIAREADAVIGTRWGTHQPTETVKRRVHELGNRVLTALSNLMTGYRVSDMECCYKLLPVPVLRRLRPMLTEQRFGIEPQIVAGLARLGAKVVEVPVRYDPRGLAAGKKIGWRDGVRALWVITRERWRGRTAAS